MLIAIITGIAVPSFGPILDQIHVKTTLQQLIADIRYAQQMALGEGKNYYIIFDVYSEAYRIQKAANPVPHVIKQVSLGDGIEILGTNFPEDRFHFTSFGAPSRGGRITVMDSRGNTYSITVLPATGRVKVNH